MRLDLSVLLDAFRLIVSACRSYRSYERQTPQSRETFPIKILGKTLWFDLPALRMLACVTSTPELLVKCFASPTISCISPSAASLIDFLLWSTFLWNDFHFELENPGWDRLALDIMRRPG